MAMDSCSATPVISFVQLFKLTCEGSELELGLGPVV